MLEGMVVSSRGSDGRIYWSAMPKLSLRIGRATKKFNDVLH